ncbi:hypothetical protein DDZ14_03855 [Maritimibacter sp. 55A14]|uniref:type II secretion system protein GspM n=1 Tax=Maritimibacter sp. 55A14 TaxID=2174844 RepID=UPI000D61F938|nr:type II secretion system protein GspM [Maritimibacter sp. 55A14]PWE33807.1 hypothetical protein DDZ14_03855 [Maritimibacter sp. 55A14]
MARGSGLALVALPAGAVFGLVQPLAEARVDARRMAAEATALERWVAEQATIFLTEEQAREAAGTGPSAAAAPIGVSGVEKSLVEAGLRNDVAELANSADGGISLRFEAVRFTVLADWLSRVAPDWGYRLAAFSLVRGEQEDLVEADLTLVPAR